MTKSVDPPPHTQMSTGKRNMAKALKFLVVPSL